MTAYPGFARSLVQPSLEPEPTQPRRDDQLLRRQSLGKVLSPLFFGRPATVAVAAPQPLDPIKFMDLFLKGQRDLPPPLPFALSLLFSNSQ